ncbi:hypothetical protein RJ639_007923 [Escallonia herrerae]|uniref:Autophagy-related protein 18h n=1 Tax=Escallonia herrerae TaxID=1293975 RepID=A0AA89AWI8_9ASTE|nr:hypothetical protein RJ639_007923 [Escallonia herrerae]
MRKSLNSNSNNKDKSRDKTANGIIPNSFRFISTCIKTVSSNVRSAGASVSGSISGDSDEHQKDQVLWACFDQLELDSSHAKRVLLLGYSNGFQVLDVEDASNVSEVVSRRDDPVTFLQMQPIPAKSEGREGFRMSHPLLLVVASDETRGSGPMPNGRDGYIESQMGNLVLSPTAVRFYSLRSHNYVHVLRFRSTVYMVRCSPQIVAVGLAAQIYCFDSLTLENKFSVLTYPVPQLGGQGLIGVNIGFGPMDVGPRWLAYASNNPLLSNTGRLSPKSLSPSPGVSPSTSPGSGNLVARYAMESSKQLASGLLNLGDMGYKSFSKYCHELLPDGSNSPVSSHSSWKAGRAAAHSTESDTAGMVVVKDFASRAVVSQFRAHTSPISALCFDPSGTLLVTASIYGNNINIFRIMPSCSQNGSGTRSYDWSSSHVHLYKLHRGMTSAVIQDICFSHYSQWIAIVSSRGTCHIFILSPFGGETGLQMQNSHVDGSNLLPILTVPWWSTSSFTINQSFSPPPPAPITLSVVSRIKNVNTGWLNTVSNAASSAAGKQPVPSGGVAAVFHRSIRQNSQPARSNVKALENLLVYSPSGYVIQYDLLPSVGGEQGESPLRTGTVSLVQMQEEDLRVKVEPVQWWDVCRRADWPEREEIIYGTTLGSQDAAEGLLDTCDYEDNDSGEKHLVKPHERSNWYLSNAEVQMRTGRMPVWQKSKIYFYTMCPPGYEEQNHYEVNMGGEVEIEKIPAREVEIRQKDLLPVFNRFHRIHSDWSDGRGIGGGRYSASSSYSDGVKGKFQEDASISHAKLVSPSSVETSRAGTPISSLEENYVINCSSSGQLSTGATIVGEAHSSSSVITSEVSNTSSNRSDLSMNILDEGPVHEDMQDTLDFGQYFQEGYCKASNHDKRQESTEAVTDVDSSSSPCDKEKCEEDGDSDDMLGGSVYAV